MPVPHFLSLAALKIDQPWLTHLERVDETLALPLGLALLLGAALLLAGRKLFWLFVGAVGFVAAMRLAGQYFGHEHSDAVLIGSLVAGLIGAVLAIFLQKVAVGLAGAATGVYLLDQFFRQGLEHYPDLGWIFLIAAALLGALMMAVVFDYALIILTSLAGAHLITETAGLRKQWLLAAYIVLVIIGISAQLRWRKRAAN